MDNPSQRDEPTARSLHVDESGAFGGDLIAVTGGTSGSAGGTVWRINSATNATLVANITNTHLEGVVTLPNDAQEWGPWANSIIAGAESKLPRALIYGISTNGVVTPFDLGISPEDVDLIRTNQDLYLVDQSEGRILKISRTLLNNFSGHLLFVQEGAAAPYLPMLFIVKWDPGAQDFAMRSLTIPLELEHATFAPINLPNL